MNEFSPGDGWRRLRKGERDQDEMIVHYGDEGSTSWVREVPVPPLPTEPYTVIRATLNDGKHPVLMLNEDGVWDASYDGYGNGIPPERITGFEVLAEPVSPHDGSEAWTEFEQRVRRETAKAVLDRVREQAERFIPKGNIIRAANAVARDFGVES